MKISTVRRTDGLGRVVLPEELRSALGLGEGASVRLTLEGRRVILEKETPQCALCGCTENLYTQGESAVCAQCIQALAEMASL
ncbi:AbrB/MazE/SpoVT family DNA-binding domain-containing protein [Allofournierella sp.]|uniref:AbrB/MazE/SpoVT family DNA-binding domain-containing protein n=1 Tax=Allofournierella sp. TaxID=1940256 RepID=UPI003AB45B5D